MGISFNPINIAKSVASSVEHGAKDFEDAMKSAVRSVDAAKQQVGSWIDQGEKYVEHKVDDGRAWLQEHGGVAGQVASDMIGFSEGLDVAVYDAGKGIVQLADGAASLANPLEWAANPDANVARVKAVVGGAEALGKIAGLADPMMWVVNPQGNEQMASALWHSVTAGFEKDPSKFLGAAAGTIGTMFIPGGGEAAALGDVGRGVELLNDASKVVDTTKALTAAAHAGSEAVDAARAGETALDVATDGVKTERVVTDGTEAARTANPLRYPEASPDNIGRPYYDGIGKTTVGPEDLATTRARWGVPETDTIAVAKTDIPGLEGITFEGGSPKARAEAGLPRWDDDPVLSKTDIKAPDTARPDGRNHAENDNLAQIDHAIVEHGISPDVEATVTISQSNKTGVCNLCKAGLGTNPNAADGAIKLFSQKYPNITLVFQSPGAIPDYIVRGGVRILP